jgi:flagellar hook-associated protein 2
MSEGINLSNVSVDANGRVSFSGLSSGIDLQGTVDAIIAARRIPIDTLEAEVEAKTLQIDAYTELSSLLNLLNGSLDALRGAVTFGNVGNTYETKQAFASGSRLDGGTASNVENLLGVTVTNEAQNGTHTLEILQVALAHKIGSGEFDSLTDDLGDAAGGASGSISGDFTINGVQIDVASTDTLKDLRDRINNANTGDSATGVTASIVSITSTQNVLILTADDTGTDITLADPNTTGVLSDLGISGDGGTTLLNELQAAQSAQFYADGLLDTTDTSYESGLQDASTTTLGSSGTLTFSTAETVDYTSTDTLQDLADAITANITGVTAEVVTDGAGVRLEITGGSAFTFSETGAGSVITDMGIDNHRLTLTRTSNTIDDLFEGVTLSLFAAEQGTTVKIDIEQDLNAVKTALIDFIDAYNAVKIFINQQGLVDEESGEADEEAGVLFGEGALANIEQSLALILGQGVTGVSAEFSVLAQIGITFVDNDALADPLLADTLEIDESTLDTALLNNPDEVRKLLSFDFSSSDPDVVLLNFSGSTTYDASGYVLNIGTVGSGVELSASINDSTVTLDDAVDGVGATTSGSFDINGTAIAYDVTTDTLDSLETAIDAAGISGVSAAVISDGSGGFQLEITSTVDAMTIDNDTGDLLTSLSLTVESYLVESANIGGTADGADDGSVTVSGNVLTVTSSSGAEDLKLLYTGSSSASGIQLDFTTGVASGMFFELDRILDSETGTIQNEIDALSDQNDAAADRIEDMLVRLEIQRQDLLARFFAMEAALATMKSILENMRQTFNLQSNN